jgi:integrase
LVRPRKKDRHLPPCVYFKHGTHWYVKKGRWEDIGADLSVALAEYAKRVSEPQKGGVPDLIDRALPVLSKKWSKNTKRQMTYAAKILKRKLAEFDPPQVKGKHCAAIKQSLSETPNMANRVMFLLRQVFSQAVEWQEVDTNPCIGIERLPEAKRTRLLSPSEWMAIYDKADPRLRLIMRVAFLTSQRIGDVLGIRRSQLTEEGIQFKQQKTGKLLLTKWTPDLQEAIRDCLALHKVPALTLFIGRKGKPPDYRSVHLQWTKACEAAKVEDARPNDGRAMAATAAEDQGKNTQKLLGHSSRAMTERYIRDRKGTVVEGPSIRQLLDVGQKREA